MFIRYAIKVSETIIERESGRKADCEPRYFSDFRGDRVITDAHVVQTFETAEEAQATIDELPVGRCGATYNNKYVYEVEPIHYSYCNMHGWSDVYPFEIIRVVSNKTIEVRAMIAELDEDFKPEIIPGGFSGHCVNQNKQTYKYRSCPEGQVMKVRLGKKGWKSAMGKHVLSTQPRKFYDYNF
jgi:hypothetical protein